MNLRTRERNIPIMYVICFFQGIVLYASISTLYRQVFPISFSLPLRSPSECWLTGSATRKR